MRAHGSAGFSLLEVILALGILAVGITTAIGLFTAATAAHKRAVDRVHIAAIAEQAYADVESALARGASPEEIEATPPFHEITRNFPGYQVTPLFYEMDGSSSSDEILLELRIGWIYRGRSRQEVFQQIIAREVLVTPRRRR